MNDKKIVIDSLGSKIAKASEMLKELEKRKNNLISDAERKIEGIIKHLEEETGMFLDDIEINFASDTSSEWDSITVILTHSPNE